MKFADEFLKTFFPSYITHSITENDKRFEAKLSAKLTIELDTALVEKAFDFLSVRDRFTMTLVIGNAEPISFYSVTKDFTSFVSSAKKELNYLAEEDEIKIHLFIDKEIQDNSVTVYDFTNFINTVGGLSASQTFAVFGRALSGRNKVRFVCYDLAETIQSLTLCFAPVHSAEPIEATIDRKACYDKLKSNCFTNHEENFIVPEDFVLISGRDKIVELTALFDRLSFIASLIYLFDYTIIKENRLEYRLNGYKTFKGVLDLSIVTAETVEYFPIYQWVYQGGNLNDKIGLARNIISLHLKEPDTIALGNYTLHSIQSAFKVYEKQNIKQYIEIRNKISDQLLDFNKQANAIVDNFASGFQKSALAVVTFFSSVLVIRILSTGDFTNVFTFDAFLITLVFIFISSLYLWISLKEVSAQRLRFRTSYTNLKKRYTDLLVEGDIEKILNKDQEFDQHINYINQKSRWYRNLWIGVLITIFLITLILHINYSISVIAQIPFFRFLLIGFN